MNRLDSLHPLDQLTRNADRAFRILFLKDPVRTSLGLVFGSALWTLSALFEPALQDLPFVNFAALSWWSWLAPGIGIMHIPTIVQLLKKPSAGSYTIDMLFEMIDRGDFSAAEKRQMYRRLIERFVDLAAADHVLSKQEGGLTDAESVAR